MDFKCTETLKHPLAQVWATTRDHLPRVAAKQDDIAYVKVKKRDTKDPRSVHVISTWRADPPLPGFLKGFIKPDMLVWTDDAVWDNEEHVCRFHILPDYQVEDIRCAGTIQFEKVTARSTRVIYSGVLTIARTAKSSIFMTGFVIRGIEALASRLIEHNFAKLIKTLDETIVELKE
jgi:hypothetical protein